VADAEDVDLATELFEPRRYGDPPGNRPSEISRPSPRLYWHRTS